ncbi:hypothetical protein [Comamonas thiooxydans]|uniref:hypothetical protein n=1 Tax=Comamonas thiooxydans TaxID=363952 RepID=UPI000B420633|nr:hypothetical protein [Comamonas thiooxydans]
MPNADEILFLVVIVLCSILTVWLAITTTTNALQKPKNPKPRDLISVDAIPPEVVAVFRRLNPQYSAASCSLAFQGLAQYFTAHLHGQKSHGSSLTALGMPSVLVDEAWHCFILCTREYRNFCEKYFGRFLDHAPNPNARPRTLDGTEPLDKGTLRLWNLVNKADQPAGLMIGLVPLLFAADSLAKIPDGWIWTPAAIESIHSQAQALNEQSTASGDSGPVMMASSCSDASGDGGSCGSGCGGD